MGLDARKPVFGVWEQQRRRPACTFALSDQCLGYSLIGRIILNLLQRNFLASLCSGGDWFESRFVGNPEDRFCRDEAQMFWSRNK